MNETEIKLKINEKALNFLKKNIFGRQLENV